MLNEFVHPDLKHRSCRKWRGLVVDDSPAVCRATGMALSSLGGEITTAGDGAQAVEIVQLARKSGLGFDLILTDVQMPKMSGIEATRRIRDDGFTGPIVAVTGSEQPDIFDICLAAGCDEFVRKPAMFETLAKIVHRFCGADEPPFSQQKCMPTAVPTEAIQA